MSATTGGKPRSAIASADADEAAAWLAGLSRAGQPAVADGPARFAEFTRPDPVSVADAMLHRLGWVPPHRFADVSAFSGSPRPGLVPKSGDAQHPVRWVLPDTGHPAIDAARDKAARGEFTPAERAGTNLAALPHDVLRAAAAKYQVPADTPDVPGRLAMELADRLTALNRDQHPRPATHAPELAGRAAAELAPAAAHPPLAALANSVGHYDRAIAAPGAAKDKAAAYKAAKPNVAADSQAAVTPAVAAAVPEVAALTGKPAAWVQKRLDRVAGDLTGLVTDQHDDAREKIARGDSSPFERPTAGQVADRLHQSLGELGLLYDRKGGMRHDVAAAVEKHVLGAPLSPEVRAALNPDHGDKAVAAHGPTPAWVAAQRVKIGGDSGGVSSHAEDATGHAHAVDGKFARTAGPGYAAAKKELATAATTAPGSVAHRTLDVAVGSIEDDDKPHPKTTGKWLTHAWLEAHRLGGGTAGEHTAPLERAMAAHGMEPVGKAGDVVSHDPLVHDGDAATGDKVKVVRPGWVSRDAKDGSVMRWVSAKVEPVAGAAAGKYAEDAAGHDHKGKGPGGGEFVGKGGGGDAKSVDSRGNRADTSTATSGGGAVSHPYFDQLKNTPKGQELVRRAMIQANQYRANYKLPPVEHELALVPHDSVTPVQTGEDYLNDSSRAQAKHVGEFGGTGRWADYMPAIVDEQNRILDGNHRHAAHGLAGQKFFPVLRPKVATGADK